MGENQATLDRDRVISMPDRVISMRGRGMTIGEICQALDRSRFAVERVLRSAGMTRKNAKRDEYLDPPRDVLAGICRQHLMDLRKERAHERD